MFGKEQMPVSAQIGGLIRWVQSLGFRLNRYLSISAGVALRHQ